MRHLAQRSFSHIDTSVGPISPKLKANIMELSHFIAAGKLHCKIDKVEEEKGRRGDDEFEGNRYGLSTAPPFFPNKLSLQYLFFVSSSPTLHSPVHSAAPPVLSVLRLFVSTLQFTQQRQTDSQRDLKVDNDVKLKELEVVFEQQHIILTSIILNFVGDNQPNDRTDEQVQLFCRFGSPMSNILGKRFDEEDSEKYSDCGSAGFNINYISYQDEQMDEAIVDPNLLFIELSQARLYKGIYKNIFGDWSNDDLWLAIANEMPRPTNFLPPTQKSMLQIVSYYSKAYIDDPNLPWLHNRDLKRNIEMVFEELCDRCPLQLGDRGIIVVNEHEDEASQCNGSRGRQDIRERSDFMKCKEDFDDSFEDV
ncbi:hypothetical protein V2J09_020213 [Rumex salicifolius]